jgi:hypothetical protein
MKIREIVRYVPALRRLSQEDGKFEVSLGYVVRPDFVSKKQNKGCGCGSVVKDSPLACTRPWVRSPLPHTHKIIKE